jgi:hypothetical protein
MESSNKILTFGEEVEGFSMPVLNEREIRAAAGILFLLMFISVMLVVFKGSFIMLKYAIAFFLADLLIRVLINPLYSPTLIMGRLIVSRQKPEYVGAAQKKFAWTIGVVIASSMFIILDILNLYGLVTGILCLICLVFLFFETAFGICLGCAFYPLVSGKKAQYCPGETCEVKKREEIQKTSASQLLILTGFIACIFATILLFSEELGKRPSTMFQEVKTAQSK